VRRGRPVLLLLVGALLLAGCSNYSGDATQRVREWATSAPWDANDQQLVSDLGDLANGLRLRRLLPLRTACEAFAADAAVLYDTLPTPDKRLTDELNTALGGFDRAARDCYASSAFSSATFRRYQRELASATATYHQAERRLAGFGVH